MSQRLVQQRILVFLSSCLLLFAVGANAVGAKPPPAAFTALIADIKFSKDGGLKLCEIQPVSSSRFRGADFAHDTEGRIASQFTPVIADVFSDSFYRIRSMCDPNVRKQFRETPHIFGYATVADIEKDAYFQMRAAEAPEDPSDLSSYPAMVYVRRASIADKRLFLKKYPGVLLMDYGVWEDTLNKTRLNGLFGDDDYLQQFRPAWNSYQKKYSKKLVKAIKSEIGSDIYVIKPIAGTKGHGIIVCTGKELDSILKRILKRDMKLRNHKNPAYRYWYYDKSKKFIVEEYAVSDPVMPEHLEGKPYDGTLRAVFVLAYTQGEVQFQLLDTYWKLPCTALDEKDGSLTDKHKSCGQTPYFAQVDADVEQAVEEVMLEFAPYMYRKMLGIEEVTVTDDVAA